MGLSSKQRSIPVRSISLPCRSHPSTERIEKLLNKAKIWETTSNPSAENICNGFSQLAELYECLDDIVRTNMSQNSLKSSNQTIKPTDELLDTSIKFLEICNNSTEIISQTLQHVRDLGCGLRRNGGECGMESLIANYIAIRSKLKRDVKEYLASLKQVEKMLCNSLVVTNSENNHRISVIWAFKEVTALSTVIFRLLLVFLATPPSKTKSSTSRWTVFTRFLSDVKRVSEEIASAHVNELQQLDAALFSYGNSNKPEFIQVVPKKLEVLQVTLEGFNSHLNLISRRLIGTRACLLNMVSFY